jgi:hypothetical protein
MKTDEAARVQLSGMLVRETFPGSPNYKSIEDGDTPETYWLVRLDGPVPTNRMFEHGLNEPTSGGTSVQLVLTPEQFELHRVLVGKKVTVEGYLFAAVTGHHHTPVLLDDVRFLPIEDR